MFEQLARLSSQYLINYEMYVMHQLHFYTVFFISFLFIKFASIFFLYPFLGIYT